MKKFKKFFKWVKSVFVYDNKYTVKAKQYFSMMSSYDGIDSIKMARIFKVKATCNKKRILITITLGSPGIFIGKSGRCIDDVQKRLSSLFEKHVEFKLIENIPFKIKYPPYKRSLDSIQRKWKKFVKWYCQTFMIETKSPYNISETVVECKNCSELKTVLQWLMYKGATWYGENPWSKSNAIFPEKDVIGVMSEHDLIESSKNKKSNIGILLSMNSTWCDMAYWNYNKEKVKISFKEFKNQIMKKKNYYIN